MGRLAAAEQTRIGNPSEQAANLHINWKGGGDGDDEPHERTRQSFKKFEGQEQASERGVHLLVADTRRCRRACGTTSDIGADQANTLESLGRNKFWTGHEFENPFECRARERMPVEGGPMGEHLQACKAKCANRTVGACLHERDQIRAHEFNEA